jgi:hypothetical protein
MKGFADYVKTIEALVDRVAHEPASSALSGQVTAALDGQPGAELRRAVDLQSRRARGAFFTSAAMAKRALRPGFLSFNEDSIIVDPTCGAGDLLLACASQLPEVHDFASTVTLWSGQLYGRDLYNEFAQAAKMRLALAAWQRCPGRLEVPLSRAALFPGITAGCGFASVDMIRKATHIVLNPPYSTMDAPEDCQWGSGRVSMAACFLNYCVTNASVGTRIVAILPEVLRSGERYRRWRAWVEQRTCVEHVGLLGQFDRWTDIDVFALELRIAAPSGNRRARWIYPRRLSTATVADYFLVSVGAVVPFRHAQSGPRLRYIHPRLLPPWGTDAGANEYRRFAGTTYEPPFVVVRRTSRRGDRHRAIGTIVTGKGPVAVENHLLVLRPKDRTIRRCQQLLSVLRSPRTDKWFDQRLRCRHLTVVAMTELPWWEDAG